MKNGICQGILLDIEQPVYSKQLYTCMKPEKHEPEKRDHEDVTCLIRFGSAAFSVHRQ